MNATAKHDMLRVYARLAHTQVLGPGRRYALWVQGCPFRCPNCMTPAALPSEGGELISVADLAVDILAVSEIVGITISGGEPFAQASNLAYLIELIRQHRDLGVIVYSGYQLHQLQRQARHHTDIARFLAQIDLLVDGLYVAELNDGLSLRGSANQRAWALTPRYQAELSQYGQAQRAVEVHLLQDAALLAGIPSPALLQHWQQLFPRTEAVKEQPKMP